MKTQEAKVTRLWMEITNKLQCYVYQNIHCRFKLRFDLEGHAYRRVSTKPFPVKRDFILTKTFLFIYLHQCFPTAYCYLAQKAFG